MLKKINRWPVYTLGLGFLLPLLSLGVYLALVVEADNKTMVFESDLPEKEIASGTIVTSSSSATSSYIELANEALYPDTKTMMVGGVTVEASVAKTWPERIKGLSDTPFLPENYVKLFIFDSPGLHSIWMKDMNYAIDIIWADEDLKIVDFKENATPESYPESFLPEQLALYVIETVSGFVADKDIKIGDDIELPVGL